MTRDTNIKRIIRDIQHGVTIDKKRWIDSFCGWKNYECDRGLDILSSIEKSLEGCELKPNHTEHPNLNFSIVHKARKTWAFRVEEALERFIVLVNQEHFSNQYNLGTNHKRESIDLISKANGVVNLYELKPWRSKNSPAYAFIELLKNYILYMKINQNVVPNALVLLAPEEYFSTYFGKEYSNASKNFFELVGIFNQKTPRTKFIMKSIGITEKEFNLEIKKLSKSSKIESKPSTGTAKYEAIQKKVMPNLELLCDSVKYHLLENNWKEFKNRF